MTTGRRTVRRDERNRTSVPQADARSDKVAVATLYEWQRRAQRHLTDLIEYGATNDLPRC